MFYIERKDQLITLAKYRIEDWKVEFIFEWPSCYGRPHYIVKTSWGTEGRFSDAIFDDPEEAERYIDRKISKIERGSYED